MKLNIHESAEDYLERILMLSKKMSKVRSIDIAVDMNYSKPSISRAIKNLKENGYINVDANGNITLTEKGLEIANRIFERHTILTKIFVALGVSKETAASDACKVEHDLSQETFDALKKYLEKNNDVLFILSF